MVDWKVSTFILCFYGLLKELRPSEPFLTEYLIEPQNANITLEEAYQDVYPVWTYSYLSVLVVVFLVTDLLRYKIVIVIEGFAYVGTWLILLYGSGVKWMQGMQFLYGIATSTEIAYHTYIYAQVDPSRYKIVTSLTRASLLMGRFLSGLIGQILVAASVTDYRGLNYIALVTVSISTIAAVCLPSVKTSVYFHRENDSEGHRGTKVHKYLKKDLMQAFKNPYVLKWSVWWSIAMCGNFQVGNFIQPLWESIAPDQSSEIFNGGVEAATTLTGAVLAFILGYVRLNWSLVGEPVLAVVSILDGVILITMAYTSNIIVAYVGYWAFRALYQMLITVASFEIARNINEDSYGLIFGLNTFFALLWQTILTIVVVDDIGLKLPPRTQFIVYGGFWIACGVLFTITAILSFYLSDNYNKIKTKGIWEHRSPPMADQT